jgi:hypothetical protein
MEKEELAALYWRPEITPKHLGRDALGPEIQHR